MESKELVFRYLLFDLVNLSLSFLIYTVRIIPPPSYMLVKLGLEVIFM